MGFEPPVGDPSYLSALPRPELPPAEGGGERRDHRRPLPPATPVRGRRPPLWLVLLLLAVLEIPAIISALRHLPHLDTRGVLVSGIVVLEAIALAVVTVVVLVGRYARAVGWIPQPGVRRSVRSIGIALVVASLALLATSASELGWPASTVTVLAVNVLMVGIFEETLFRGMLWAALPARWSAARVLLVTSVLFGSWHIFNGLVTGNWGGALLQAVFASFLGLGLGALRLRSGWLGLGVLVHASLDAAVTAGQLVATRPHAEQTLQPTTIVSLLAFEALYVTLGITGVVVLVRTFLAERRVRRDVAAGDPRLVPQVG